MRFSPLQHFSMSSWPAEQRFSGPTKVSQASFRDIVVCASTPCLGNRPHSTYVVDCHGPTRQSFTATCHPKILLPPTPHESTRPSQRHAPRPHLSSTPNNSCGKHQ